MTLQELLAKADLPGELEFKDDKGNVFKLSDLRAFGSGVETERKTFEQKRAEAERVGKEALELLNGLKAAVEENERNRVTTNEPPKKDWRKNPLYDEIVPVVEALEAQVKAAAETISSTKKSLDQSQAVYALERMRRQFAEANLKDVKFEDVVAEVLAKKEVDSFGLPTLERFIKERGEPDRIKAAVDEALKKRDQEWEQKNRMASVGKAPGSSTRFTTQKAGEPPIKKLEELTSEKIANDPDIANAMAGETIQ